MDSFTKNSIKNLAILTLSLATLILLFSHQQISLPSKVPTPVANTSLVHKDDLELALEKAMMPNKTVIIAVINKAYVEPQNNEYPTMFDLFLEGFWAGKETSPLVKHLVVVSMDDTAFERCMFRRLNCYRIEDGGGTGYAGEKIYMSQEFIEMMWKRTLFLLEVLKRGYNFIFTDTDVLWLRNPFPQLSTNETFDLQISTDFFNGNSSSEKNLINTGFYFIQSNNKTISLFQTWYDMRTNSTGMKEQDVLLKLVKQGVLGQLGLKTRFLNTLYFSGFCTDSKDVRLVNTVHANCCRSIRAKVLDLKKVLADWKRSKLLNKLCKSNNDRYSTKCWRSFRWSKHVSCVKSWNNTSFKS